MKDLLLPLLHLAVTAAKLCRPGGVRAVIAENLLLKQQLIVLRRSRQRAPNLRVGDRLLCGFGALFLSPGRIRKVAIGLRPSTLLTFQSYWVLVVMDQFTRRLVGVGVHRGPVDAPSLCRMCNAAIHGRGAPRHLSTDHDPLFEAHRWTANLRLLEIDEIKTVPHVPLSHPFVERLIGTMRRECLDQVLCWNAGDLERKLADFQASYNAARSHASWEGYTPLGFAGERTAARAEYNHVRWISHCRGMVQLPAAA